MRRLIIILFIFAIGLNAQQNRLQSPGKLTIKDDLNLPNELESRISEFFINVSQNKIETAYNKLLVDSPMREKENQMRTLISETYRAIEFYGNNMGYESVDKQKPSNSILRARYIGLHENYPVRWVFTFYDSPTLGWIVLNIKFDDMSQYYFDEFVE